MLGHGGEGHDGTLSAVLFDSAPEKLLGLNISVDDTNTVQVNVTCVAT
jgi:hypothetical protein